MHMGLLFTGLLITFWKCIANRKQSRKCGFYTAFIMTVCIQIEGQVNTVHVL